MVEDLCSYSSLFQDFFFKKKSYLQNFWRCTLIIMLECIKLEIYFIFYDEIHLNISTLAQVNSTIKQIVNSPSMIIDPKNKWTPLIYEKCTLDKETNIWVFHMMQTVTRYDKIVQNHKKISVVKKVKQVPDVESNLISMWDAEAPHPPLCFAGAAVPSSMDRNLSGRARTKSLRVASSFF